MCIFCNKEGIMQYMISLKSDMSRAIDVILSDDNQLCIPRQKCDNIKINVYTLLQTVSELSVELCDCDIDAGEFESTVSLISKHLNNVKKLLTEILNVEMIKEVHYLHNCSWTMEVYGTIQLICKELLIRI